MITRRRLFILAMLVGLVILAIPKHSALTTSNGTILSIDERQLVVFRTVNGQSERLRFTLKPETVRSGSLAVGTRVAIHYVRRNRENIATSIQPIAGSGGF